MYISIINLVNLWLFISLLVTEVGSGSRIGDILEAINVVVALKKKENNTSYISEIAEVEGYNYDSKKYILKYIYKSNGENLKV